jgi:hypothetical protein
MKKKISRKQILNSLKYLPASIALLLPLPSTAQPYYQNTPPPYGDLYCPGEGSSYPKPCDSGWGSKLLTMGGAVLVGALAGALGGVAASSDGNRGHIGPQGCLGPTGPTGGMGVTGPAGITGPQGPTGPLGPTGPTGPSPFVIDENEVITFTLTLNVSGATGPAGATATIAPFVSSPDGTIHFSANQTISLSPNSYSTSIFFENPIRGTFTAGFQLLSNAVNPITAITLSQVMAIDLDIAGISTEVVVPSISFIGLSANQGAEISGQYTLTSP